MQFLVNVGRTHPGTCDGRPSVYRSSCSSAISVSVGFSADVTASVCVCVHAHGLLDVCVAMTCVWVFAVEFSVV